MRKIIIDGKQIVTNYGEKTMGNLVSGNDLPNHDMYMRKSRETNEDFFKRLVEYGYTRIRFGEVSTRIRGFHDVVAYCQKKKMNMMNNIILIKYKQ